MSTTSKIVLNPMPQLHLLALYSLYPFSAALLIDRAPTAAAEVFWRARGWPRGHPHCIQAGTFEEE